MLFSYSRTFAVPKELLCEVFPLLIVTISHHWSSNYVGNEIPGELIQTLLKMAPTAEEELKLRLFTGELTQLGPAERFLKIMVDIPFAFKRLETILFMSILEEESAVLRDAFVVLEVRYWFLQSQPFTIMSSYTLTK